MGSWNATCGLSGLPISCGDPVVGMFIQDDNFGLYDSDSGHRKLTPCYVFDNFSPASMLVRGTYNDYGSIELDVANTALIMATADEARSYHKDVLISKEGEKPKYGFAMGHLDKSFDIEDGHIQGGRGDDPARPFAIWMAHAGIYDKLVNEIMIESCGSSPDYKPVTRSIKEVTQAQIMTNLAKMESDEPRLFIDSPWRESTTLKGAAFRYIDGLLVDSRRSVKAYLAKQGKSVADDDDNQVTPEIKALLVGCWADLFALYMVMGSLRLTLHPTGSCGSQDGELDPHKVRWKAMSEYIAAREEKYRQWDAEYGDEDEDGAEQTA